MCLRGARSSVCGCPSSLSPGAPSAPSMRLKKQCALLCWSIPSQKCAHSRLSLSGNRTPIIIIIIRTTVWCPSTHTRKNKKKSRTKIASWPGGVCLERALHHQKSARARCGQRPPLLHAAPPPKKHGRKEWLRKLVRAPPTTQRGPRAQAHAKKKKWKKEEDFFASGVVRWVGLVGVCARRLSKHTDKPARGPLNEQAALEIIHFPLHGAAAADDAADDAPAFGRVASSTKYTMPRQLTPLWLLRLISHVRLVE